MEFIWSVEWCRGVSKMVHLAVHNGCITLISIRVRGSTTVEVCKIQLTILWVSNTHGNKVAKSILLFARE